jgi:lipopolysaccharide export system protein LptC
MNTQQLHIHPASARFRGIITAPDRSQSFKAARRHSAVVRTLKIALPLCALAVAGLYFVPSKLTFDTAIGEASVEKVDLSSGALKMVSPRIRGVHEKHGVYDIRAESATQQVTEPEVMTFDSITAELVNPEGRKTTLTAPSGIFHSKKEELMFDNGVLIGGEAGISGTLKTAKAYMKDDRLVSTDPVELAYHGHRIRADGVTVYSGESRVIFTGNVRVHLQRTAQDGGQQ